MNSQENQVEICINVRRLAITILVTCLCFELLLVITDITINYNKITAIRDVRRFFNIAREDSLASWFASTQTLMVGLTLWFIVLIKRHHQTNFLSLSGWIILAVFFTYIAMDDGTALHERVGTAVEYIFEDRPGKARTTGWTAQIVNIFPSYYWQLTFGPVFLTIGCFLLLFLWHEFKELPRRILLLAALTCFIFAVSAVS